MLQAPRSEGAFLKGLAVVDDVAYFGFAPHAMRSARGDAGLDCALAAFDLQSRALLWMRKVQPLGTGRPPQDCSQAGSCADWHAALRRAWQVPTHGLLNVVAAPQLSEASTYRAVSSHQHAAASTGSLAGESVPVPPTLQLGILEKASSGCSWACESRGCQSAGGALGQRAAVHARISEARLGAA